VRLGFDIDLWPSDQFHVILVHSIVVRSELLILENDYENQAGEKPAKHTRPPPSSPSWKRISEVTIPNHIQTYTLNSEFSNFMV